MPGENLANLKEETAEIVAAYVQHNQIPADQVDVLIRTVHGALSGLGKPTERQEEPTPAVPIRRSVTHDYVVCLDCGWRGKMVRRHIATAHNLSPMEYRARWNLSREHPLTAPAYSEQRSGLAKQLGLGRPRRDGKVARSGQRKRAEKHATLGRRPSKAA